MKNLITNTAGKILYTFNKNRKLFKNLFDKNGFENDNQYDWVPLLIKKNDEL
jgi:hypothetical protein